MIIKVSSESLGITIEKRERSSSIDPSNLHAGDIRFNVPNPWTPIHDGSVKDFETFKRWERGIPRHCKCQADYKSYKASTPPDFSSPQALWLWGFHLHNWVNRKLGKPELTVDEARLQWSKQDGKEIASERVGGTTVQQVS